MTTQEGLTPDPMFEADGHVSELCVTCVADGELALVPKEALDHLDACDACGDKLGQAALLSAVAGDALRLDPARALVTTRPHVVADIVVRSERAASPRRARRPFPVAAIAAAIAIAALSAWPAFSETLRSAPAVASALLAWMPLLVRLGATLLFGESSPLALLIRGAGAVVLVLLGIVVARMMSRVHVEAVKEGGVR